MSKLLIMLLSLLSILSFSGCVTKVEYIDRVKIEKQNVLVKCEVEEPSGCNWSDGSTAEVAPKMLECIIEQKKLLEKCRGN